MSKRPDYPRLKAHREAQARASCAAGPAGSVSAPTEPRGAGEGATATAGQEACLVKYVIPLFIDSSMLALDIGAQIRSNKHTIFLKCLWIIIERIVAIVHCFGCNSHTDTDHCQLRIGTTLSRVVTSAL